MTTSQARIEANRKNALLSSGPKTPEGKAASRANAYKHGLTGQGVITPADEADELQRRHQALLDEMAPKSERGHLLVFRIAMLTLRLERSARAETASIAMLVRHAEANHDDRMMDHAEDLFDGLAESPRKNLRRLRRSFEGLTLLVEAWTNLRLALVRPGRSWTPEHLVRAARLMGLTEEAARLRRVGRLSDAILGDFSGLGRDEGAGLADDARREWAVSQMAQLIQDEAAELEAHAQTLDENAFALDRAEASERAWFDPSSEATLARRYESATSRSLSAALKEYRLAESEAAAALVAASASASAPAPVVDPAPEAVLSPSSLGSFGELDAGPSPESLSWLAEASRLDSRDEMTPFAGAMVALTVGRTFPTRA
jgi:hypothetical protein